MKNELRVRNIENKLVPINLDKVGYFESIIYTEKGVLKTRVQFFSLKYRYLGETTKNIQKILEFDTKQVFERVRKNTMIRANLILKIEKDGYVMLKGIDYSLDIKYPKDTALKAIRQRLGI